MYPHDGSFFTGTIQSKSATYRVENLEKIFLFTKCWDDWHTFTGEIEGYIYRKASGCHKGLCICQIDSKEKIARFDLFVDSNKKSWRVEIIPSDWKPKSHTVITFPNTWHLALLISAVASFGAEFGDLRFCCNNCVKWSSGLVAYLQNPDKYSVLKESCPNPINDGVKLVKYIKESGCELGYKHETESKPEKKFEMFEVTA